MEQERNVPERLLANAPDSSAVSTTSSPGMDWMLDELDATANGGRLRRLRLARTLPGGWVELDGQVLLNLCSNDYLGLASQDTTNPLASKGEAGTGATASRLIVGNHPLYAEVEEKLATLKGTESALVFGCGYLANSGVIPALAGRGDAIFSDRLNHASMIDGIRLSGARLFRYRHNDLDHLAFLLTRETQFRRRLLLSESVFSMDGDVANLTALADLRDRHRVMFMLDEAHAGGVFGPRGAGLAAEMGVSSRVDVQMGTFSKAYGVYGGYIAGTRCLTNYLVNRARSLIFTTGLPPMVLAAISSALDRAARADAERQKLATRAACFRKQLQDGGLDIGAGTTQIVPIMVGDSHRAVQISEHLLRQGIAALPIRPPTVPAGTARLRCSLSASHSAVDLEDAARQIIAAFSGV